MRKMLVIIAISLLGIAAMAQDKKKGEVYGGYSYLHLDTQGTGSKANFNGWNTEVAGKFNRNIGVVADFSGHYDSEKIGAFKADGRMHTFLFGPRFYAPSGKLTPFAHAVFGVARSTLSLGFAVPTGIDLGDNSISQNNFAMALGGGLDYELRPGIALRPAKLDYLYVRRSGESTNNFRYSAGVVFRF